MGSSFDSYWGENSPCGDGREAAAALAALECHHIWARRREQVEARQDLQTVLCDWYWYCPHLQNHQNALTRAANS
ncbi:hypothetical protein VULLAG_LOCUS21286 [Vulpes lagopus]